MGAFDDLISDSGGSSFADLLPVKKKIGAGEVAERAGSSFLSSANAYAAMPAVGVARLLDIGNRVLGLRQDQPSYTDVVGEHLVEPNLRRIERAAVKPGETAGSVGNVVLEAAPEFGKTVPDIAEGGALATAAPRAAIRAGAPVLERVIANLRNAMPAGVPAGERRTVERSEELRAAGVDPLTAAGEGAASGLMTTGQFAMPASAPSAASSLAARVVSRGAQGAALNTAAGASTRAVENAMLPDQAASLRQPVLSPQAAALDAITGALFGQMGERAEGPPPSREALGYRDLSLAPLEERAPPAAPQAENDPQAALKAVSEALFRTEPGAPTAPNLQLVPKDAEMGATSALGEEYAAPRAPDLSTSGSRADLEAARRARQESRTVEQPPVIAVNSRGEAIPADENLRPTDQGTVAGFMQNELARRAGEEADARRAFDIAESQRERKQGAQDTGGRDLRESRAGGSTSAEGTAATTPERFNFLDVTRDRKGNVASTGPEVKIESEVTVKDKGKDVPGYRVSYMREAEGGGRELAYEDVPQSRVSALERPKNPRFSQDIAASSYAPPRGVGTGEQQPKPREAAQRITTEPSPEFIPAERAAQRGEATRAGRDVTDLAFDRIENKGGDHAGAVRSDQGQALVARQATEGGAERGGRYVQRAAAAGEHANGAELRGEGEHRGEDAVASRQGVLGETDSIAAFEQERDKAFKAGVAGDMRNLAKSAGWAERGGRLIRYKHSEVQGDETISRTKWIGQEWYAAMRQSLGRKGLSERGPIMLAVEKWLEGEPLNQNERSTVDYMLGEVMDLRDQAEFIGMKHEDAQAADVGLAQEGIERTPQNLYDVDYLSRVDQDVLERLAMQHGDDTEAFMRSVAEEVKHEGSAATKDQSQGADTRGGGRAESEAGPDTATVGGQERGVASGGEHGVDERAGGAQGESRPELNLERPTEQQLRQRDAEQRRVSEEKARKDSAPPPEEFTLSGSDRAADQAAAHGQDELFDQPSGKKEPWQMTEEEYVDSRLDSMRNNPGDSNYKAYDNYARLKRASEYERGRRSALQQEWMEANEKAANEGKAVKEKPRWMMSPEEYERVTGNSREEYDMTIASARERGDRVYGTTGPGTLSANPFANPTLISQALKWAFGDAQAWTNKVRELGVDIKSLTGGRPGDARNVVVKIISYVADSAAADMRGAIRATGNSRAALDVMDKLHNVAGEGKATGETFHDAVRARVNKNLVEMHRLLGDDLMHDEPAMKQVAALVRNPSGIKAGSKIHDAADGIRKMLDETLKYMKAAGVDVGEVKGGYYPREYDVNAVMRDPKGFIEAVARAYRDGGMDASASAMAARELHDGILYGETDTIFKGERGATRAPFVRGRVFGKEVDNATHPLNKFLMSDPALSLAKYFERASKRAETARRFGDNFANWHDISQKIISEGSGAILKKLSDYVSLDMGLRNAAGMGGVRASSVIRTWGALSFLEKATLSSLTEFMVPALRSGNVMDIARSFKNTMGDLFTRTSSAAERRAFAEDLGLISGHISSALASARFAGGEPVGRIESKVLDAFFKRTGLNQWTDATRVAAGDGARVFIRRLAKDMENDGALTKRYLAELGVPTEQAKDFARYVLGKSDGMPAAGDLTGSLGDVYRTAVRKFVSQSIMDPTHGSRPKWMSHPVGSIIGQLQAFNYAFYENVLKRNTRLAKDALTAEGYTMAERAQMVMPTLMLPLVTAAAFAIGEARDAALGDPQKQQDETGGQKLLKAISRGTPIAPIDSLINYASSARYGRSATESFAGPALGTLGRAVDASRDYFLKNSENTNTQERRALKAIWDVLIEPTINLALYSTPNAPALKAAAAAATQAAGSGNVREKLFVEPVAGEAKKKNEAGRAAGRSAGRTAGRS